LFVDQQFVGGHDVVKEMHEANELASVLLESGAHPNEDINTRLEKLTKSKPVMLFIKGSIDQPACGFTSKLLFALKDRIIRLGDKIG